MNPRTHLLLLATVLTLSPVESQAADLDLDNLDWHSVAPGKLGINLNYLLDGQIPGAQLLKKMQQSGSRWLRYPGGEKSDNHLWSIPPFEKPQPRAALSGVMNWPTGDARFFTARDGLTWAVDPLDFDEFLALAQKTGAKPIVVVAQEAAFKPKDENHGSISEEALIEAAVAWVTYAKTRGGKVRYWEIGNEPFLNGSQNAQDYARSWDRFARAMKAADPDILLGVNGPDSTTFIDAKHPDAGPWWQGFLATAEVRPDWISLHDYPCYKWMGYEAYTTRPVNALAHLQDIRQALATAYGGPYSETVPILVTETNSADWFGHPEQRGWKHDSSLGHGLVLFDMLGQYLMEPQIAAALVWNTRWLENAIRPQLWDAVAPNGTLLPTGKALALWTRFYPEKLAVVPSSEHLRIYAGKQSQPAVTFLYILNKSLKPQALDLPSLPARHHIWRGDSPDSPTPTWQESPPAKQIHLPPHSLSIIQM